MKGFLGLTRRNLLVFFKDKQSVVFSLLTSIIVFALYILFLKGYLVDAVNSALEEFPSLSQLISSEDVDMFVNLIQLTGILGSAMITVPYNCLATLIRDRENKIDYDILATPIKRSRVILSYFVASALSAVILTCIIFTVGIIFLSTQGNVGMSVADVFETYGVVAFGSVSATALFMILALSFKSSSASGAFFGMLSAASGFVIGAYMPVSQFSDNVQTICNIFPASHITIILRNKLLEGTLERFDGSLGGMDNGMFVKILKDIYSFKAHLFNSDLNVGQMTVYVLIILVICLLTQVIVYSKNYKK